MFCDSERLFILIPFFLETHVFKKVFTLEKNKIYIYILLCSILETATSTVNLFSKNSPGVAIGTYLQIYLRYRKCQLVTMKGTSLEH